MVMEAGQIVEMGKHDELIAQRGAYWRLYEAQARQAEKDRGVGVHFGSQGTQYSESSETPSGHGGSTSTQAPVQSGAQR